jgi:hypothetical protein
MRVSKWSSKAKWWQWGQVSFFFSWCWMSKKYVNLLAAGWNLWQRTTNSWAFWRRYISVWFKVSKLELGLNKKQRLTGCIVVHQLTQIGVIICTNGFQYFGWQYQPGRQPNWNSRWVLTGKGLYGWETNPQAFIHRKLSNAPRLWSLIPDTSTYQEYQPKTIRKGDIICKWPIRLKPGNGIKTLQ